MSVHDVLSVWLRRRRALGWPATLDDAAVEGWLDSVRLRDRGPALIRAGHGARDWMNRSVTPILSPWMGCPSPPALAITPQAAFRLLRQLITAGVIREATGRAAWRAFTTP